MLEGLGSRGGRQGLGAEESFISQVLAVLAAVDSAIFRRTPKTSQQGTSSWPVHTEHWVSGGAETVKRGMLGEPKTGEAL